MKILIFGIALLGSISTTNASIINASQAMSTQENITSKATGRGDRDAKIFQEIMYNSRFYALLSSLRSESPELTRSAEYVMLINEIHLLNKKLTLIAESLQSANTNNKNQGGFS